MTLAYPLPQPFRVVLTAAPNAPYSHNFQATLTGTAAAPVPSATSNSCSKAILGSKSQFNGPAMTRDGKLLLAANVPDGSLAVIDPDNPTNTYAIAVAQSTSVNNCTVGPQYVTATNNGLAFVVTGSILGTSGCLPEGNPYMVNLASRTSANLPNISTCTLNLMPHLQRTSAQTLRWTEAWRSFGQGAYGNGCIYSVASNSYAEAATATRDSPAYISGDGNISRLGNRAG